MPKGNHILVLAATETMRSALEALLRNCCSYIPMAVECIPQNLDAVAQLVARESVDTIILELSLSAVKRSEHTGLKFAQQLRRKNRFRGFFVFLGLLPPHQAARQFSLLGSYVPGGKYINLPATAPIICEALDGAVILSEFELKEIVIGHCGFKDGVRSVLHDVSNRLTRVMGQISTDIAVVACERLEHLRDELQWYGFENPALLVNGLCETLSTVEYLTADDIKAALRQLEHVEEVFIPKAIKAPQMLVDAQTSAPLGLETILVADDDGYPQECVAYLESCGYSVLVVTSYEEAALTLSADPAAVFLCDQVFGENANAGRELMKLARQEPVCLLVVALSGSGLELSEVPEAQAVCAGPIAKTEEGARLLHNIICKWAMNG